MVTSNSPDIPRSLDKELLKEATERSRRHFAAVEASHLGCHGVSAVCVIFEIDKNTVYRGLKELKSKEHLPDGRIRKPGGGRKSILSKHPEYTTIFYEIVKYTDGGLPQDENVKFLKYKPSKICEIFELDYHIVISKYLVRQIIDAEGFTYRKPLKDLPMSDCKDRDEQFENIAEIRKEFETTGQPILSMDTKKKELIGNFRRGDGKTYCREPQHTFDHDYPTFSEGKMVPHGIYDVSKNTGYMAFGMSHDTAEFACDNIAYFWERTISYIYPHAKTILLLCDGGGSNSARGWLFKWALIQLAKRLHVDIRVAHYPPYNSKWNPIEHRLFSQISRSWDGVVFDTLYTAVELAASTRTSTGLAVFTSINSKTYETNKEREANFEEECKKHIFYDEKLPKWNYVIRWNC